MTDPIEVMARAIYLGDYAGSALQLLTAQSVLSALTAAGLKVLPREPSDKMSVAGVHGDEYDEQTWRQMWDAA